MSKYNKPPCYRYTKQQIAEIIRECETISTEHAAVEGLIFAYQDAVQDLRDNQETFSR